MGIKPWKKNNNALEKHMEKWLSGWQGSFAAVMYTIRNAWTMKKIVGENL